MRRGFDDRQLGQRGGYDDSLSSRAARIPAADVKAALAIELHWDTPL